MAQRRRPYRLAGTTTKALPSALVQAGGRTRSLGELMPAAQADVDTTTAVPLPRDLFPYAFGPGVPLVPAPLDPVRPDGRPEPRLYDYPVSWNLPGVGGGRLVPWRILRDAANLPLIRDCLRIRKAEVATLDWDITLARRAVDAAQRANPTSSKLDLETELREKLAGEIDRAVRFWTAPDPGNGYTFTEWITQALEEHLVLDALAIYPRRTLGGDLYALEILDGSTIKPLLDHRGGRPQPPQPAYQQLLHGFPRGEFTADTSDTGPYGQLVVPAGYTADQLIYIRREVRTWTPYGLSPVEQALADIDLWQKRVAWLRAEYTDGVMPSGWLLNQQTGASAWNPQQIAEYERELNDYYAGNTAARMRYRVLPPGLLPHEGTEGEAERYKPDYDLHLLKLVVAHFDLTVHELGFTEAKGLGSSGHAQGQQDLNERKSTLPTLKWLAALLTEISRTHLGMPAELEFRWLDLDDDDTAAQDAVVADRVATGRITLNEARDEIGRPRYSFPEADKPAVIAATGTITFLEGSSEPKPAPPQLAPFTGQPDQPVADATGPNSGASGSGSQGTDGEDDGTSSGTAGTGDESVKAAEAAAYHRWVRKHGGAGQRRFVLHAIASPSDLASHSIDPAHVTIGGGGLGKAPAGPPGPSTATSPTTGPTGSPRLWRARSTPPGSPTPGPPSAG